MFPNFLVVITKTNPATPQTLERHTFLEAKPANSIEEATTIMYQRVAYWQNSDSNPNKNEFGPGAVTFQGEIYIQRK